MEFHKAMNPVPQVQAQVLLEVVTRKSDSSSSSSDSTGSVHSDSEDLDGMMYKKKMSSSMNKSPICDGKRDGFEEWHSKWEVFGQDSGFD